MNLPYVPVNDNLLNINDWGLICNRCTIKQGLKEVCTTSYVKVVIYKHNGDGGVGAKERKLWPMRMDMLLMAMQMVSWWIEGQLYKDASHAFNFT